VKKYVLAALLISLIIVTAACVPPPGPGVKGGHLPPLPPPLLFPAPPLLAFWPDYDIYVCMNVSSDLVFYRGTWYRKHDGGWYRGGDYNGPWKWVPPGQMPKSLRGLPVNARDRLRGQPSVTHQDMKKNWRKWEQERKSEKKRDRTKVQDKKQDRAPKHMEQNDKRSRDEKSKDQWQEKKNRSQKEDTEKERGSKGKKKGK